MGYVIAIQSFDDHRFGKVKKNAAFDMPDSLIEAYERAGLVRINGEQIARPESAPGKPSSALPAGPVLPPKTAKASGKRGRKAKAAR